MRKRTLRALLGAGYVCLLTTLLLYQADVFGKRREWTVAVFGTLILGVALAVVLSLYLRTSDRITKSEEKPRADMAGQGREEAQAAMPEPDRIQNPSAGNEGMPGNAWAAEGSQPPRSYEEIYAKFLTIMEAGALSEREGALHRRDDGQEACVPYLSKDGCVQQKGVPGDGAGECVGALRPRRMSPLCFPARTDPLG